MTTETALSGDSKALSGKDKALSGNKTALTLLAPISGQITPLSAATDPLIRHKVLGDGIAIEPVGNRLVSPVDGQIKQLAATGHHLTIFTKAGIEIQLFIGQGGLETHGLGFTKKIKTGDKIKVGQTLVELDMLQLQQQLQSTLISVLITKGAKSVEAAEGQVRAGEDVLMTVLCAVK